MDEPLSNLDAKLKMHMRTELQRIQEDLDTTTLYVTHDQEEAMTMSDRIIIIAEGTIQQVGTPDEIYNHPTNLFVADFIGSPAMNLFDVRLEGTMLVGDGFEYELSEELAWRAKANGTGNELVLGIRPEDISIASEPGPNTVETTVDVVEPVGSDNYLYVRLAGQECTVRAGADVRPEPGDTALLTFNESNIHLFDAETDTNVLSDGARVVEQPA
jgi:multiple sugar transport system ATP-binding protein